MRQFTLDEYVCGGKMAELLWFDENLPLRIATIIKRASLAEPERCRWHRLAVPITARIMQMSGTIGAQLVPISRCRHGSHHPVQIAPGSAQRSRSSNTYACTRRQRCLGPRSQRSVEMSATRDRFRLAAASPALDSSGGDLPPISNNTKPTAEDDDADENNSAQDIERILSKVFLTFVGSADL